MTTIFPDYATFQLSCLFQIDHLNEERKTLNGYETIADKEALGDLAPYLLNYNYKEVIEGCLLKHSKRSSSNQVSLLKM